MNQPHDPMSASRRMVEALAERLHAQVVETHISWVLLTDSLAYKLKKPLRLPFLDYSTPARRLAACREELRVNRRAAPSLYLGVSRVVGDASAPAFDDEAHGTRTASAPTSTAAPVHDYAVRMRRFPAGALFSERLADGLLSDGDVDSLAAALARSHAAAPARLQVSPARLLVSPARLLVSPARLLVSPARLPAPPARPAAAHQPLATHRRALAALAGARPLLTEAESAELAQWFTRGADVLAPLWRERAATGHVRECHGDLHLANVVWMDGQATPFDAIEFDAALRWIDVAEDAAFAAMDFAARGRADYCWRFLSAWMDATGEHDAAPVLRHALVYRALVRAQVECLRGGATPRAMAYARAALAWARPARPRLVITHGLPGSGKTYRSQRWLQADGALRVRSDVERKRLFGLGALDDSRARGVDIYGSQATRRTYDRLFALARIMLRAGFSAVIDAAFLRRDERDAARAVAAECGAGFGILACEVPAAVARQRLAARTGDASEADARVHALLSAQAEPLGADETVLAFAPDAAAAEGRQPSPRPSP